MLVQIDGRLSKKIVHDLAFRASKLNNCIGIVFDASYKSMRVTENEWKHDFKLPPHLKCGSLEKYDKFMPEHFYGNAELRTSLGLIGNNKDLMSCHDLKQLK